jgi:hypothetical protein
MMSGRSVALDAGLALAQSIADKAQKKRNNPAAADHFAEAANNLQAAYEQDKTWLAKHTDMPQVKRS